MEARRLLAVVGICAGVGMAGCGGGGDGDDTSTATNDVDRQIEPAAQARAESIGLQLSDFPEGWRASAPDADQAGQEEFDQCVGLDSSGITVTGDANSQDFDMDDSEVDSRVRIYASTQQTDLASQRYAAALRDDATVEDCFRDFMERALREDDNRPDVEFEFGDIDLGELSFTPPAGIEEANAWQLEIPFEITSGQFEGVSQSLFLELVVLRQGDARALVTTQGEDSPFDSSVRDQLVQAVASRMQEPPN